MHRNILHTGLGYLVIESGNNKLSRISFSDDLPPDPCPGGLAARVQKELEEYFAGKRIEFNLPMEQEGTAFQKKVWEALLCIPYGQCVSYQDVALQIGNPRAVRAVGQAVGKNPLTVVVPCHRVIGKDGSLTGFSDGIELKRGLLDLEQKNRTVRVYR